MKRHPPIRGALTHLAWCKIAQKARSLGRSDVAQMLHKTAALTQLLTCYLTSPIDIM